MFRFVTLLWNVAAHEQSSAAQELCRQLRRRSPQWRVVLSKSGMTVLCADALAGGRDTHLLANDAGVVLGSLFRRNASVEDETVMPLASLDEEASAEVLQSGGRRLIDRYWGNYVAFLHDASQQKCWVLKDPTGELPCFKTMTRGVAVFFSCVSDCLALNLRFTVNRTFLVEHMTMGSSNPDRNALNEAWQVHRGECIEIALPDGTEVSRRYYWNPTSFVESDESIEDPSLAARAMRATIRACTHTLTAGHTRVLHRLSGGLDSSIVLGCLQEISSKPQVVCYTYFAPNGRSDERRWARFAARHCDCEHFEVPMDPSVESLRDLLALQPSIEPVAYRAHVQRAALERRLATDRHATAVFTGLGGDSGFGSEAIPYVAVEYLRKHGLNKRFLNLSLNVALRTELTFWRVVARSIHRWLFGYRMHHQNAMLLKACRLVSPELLTGLDGQHTYPHPWFHCTRGVPWSIIRRLGTLLYTPEFYDLSCEPETFAPEIISPLYAQPSVELLLRIPLYMHFEGGRDRGLARRAFERELPLTIARRQWKDRAPGVADRLLQNNWQFLREFLLDGVLIREKLLNRVALEEALANRPTRTVIYPGELLKHLDTEIWVRSWTSASSQAMRAVA